MGKMSVLIQGVVIYLLFIIGIAIISEHICRKAMHLRKVGATEYFTETPKASPVITDDLLEKVNAKLNEISPKIVLDTHSNNLVTLNDTYSAIEGDVAGARLGTFSKVPVSGKTDLSKNFFEITKQEILEVDSKYIFNVPAFDPKVSSFATL
jgi:hypothetical protein